MPFKFPKPLNDILKGIRDITITILKTEKNSPAGRNNAMFGFFAFIILIALIIPDYIITSINIVLSSFNRPQIPQVPILVIIFFLFMVMAYWWWCVWYLNNNIKKF